MPQNIFHSRKGYEQLYNNICRETKLKPENIEKWPDMLLLSNINTILSLNNCTCYSHDETEHILDELAK